MEGPSVLISEVGVVSKKQMDVELLEQHLAQSKCEVSEVGWLKGRDTQEPPATNL